MLDEQSVINATANVARGAAFLDQKAPFWFDKVDFSKFDIQDPKTCVLRQVFGGYGNTLEMLNLTCNNVIKFAFCSQNGLRSEEMTPIWEAAAKLSKHRMTAYFLWEQAGRPEGRQDEFWFAASSQL